MKFKSQLLTQASGSIGGLTASHNRGGLYLRARSIPTNPASAQQQAVRNAVGNLTSYYVETLTAAQRAAWQTYADNVPIVDPLGEARNVTGLNMFVRSNVPRIQTSLPQVNDAPTTYDLGGFTDPSIDSVDSGAGTIDIAFTDSDAWANEDAAAMLIYCSRQQAQSINFFKGPYRLAGLIAGDSVTPPASPATLTLPFAVAVGNKVFVQLRVSRVDGRLSSPFRLVGVGA